MQRVQKGVVHRGSNILQTVKDYVFSITPNIWSFEWKGELGLEALKLSAPVVKSLQSFPIWIRTTSNILLLAFKDWSFYCVLLRLLVKFYSWFLLTCAHTQVLRQNPHNLNHERCHPEEENKHSSQQIWINQGIITKNTVVCGPAISQTLQLLYFLPL